MPGAWVPACVSPAPGPHRFLKHEWPSLCVHRCPHPSAEATRNTPSLNKLSVSLLAAGGAAHTPRSPKESPSGRYKELPGSRTGALFEGWGQVSRSPEQLWFGCSQRAGTVPRLGISLTLAWGRPEQHEDDWLVKRSQLLLSAKRGGCLVFCGQLDGGTADLLW